MTENNVLKMIKGLSTQCCKSVKNRNRWTLVRSIGNKLIYTILLYMVRGIQSMFIYIMSLYMSQKTWACGLWYKIYTNIFIRSRRNPRSRYAWLIGHEPRTGYAQKIDAAAEVTISVWSTEILNTRTDIRVLPRTFDYF